MAAVPSKELRIITTYTINVYGPSKCESQISKLFNVLKLTKHEASKDFGDLKDPKLPGMSIYLWWLPDHEIPWKTTSPSIFRLSFQSPFNTSTPSKYVKPNTWRFLLPFELETIIARVEERNFNDTNTVNSLISTPLFSASPLRANDCKWCGAYSKFLWIRKLKSSGST